jgi:shikimate dehydrogenase
VDPVRVCTVMDRLSEQAAGRVRAGASPSGDAADLVVNATPLGLREDDQLPFDPTRLAPGTVVADIIMTPRETRLLRAAAAHGLPVHHGIHMLSEQVRMYREFFGLSQAGQPD